MKEIPLTKGQVALVDDEDYDFLMQWSWCAIKGKHGNFYATRSTLRGKNKKYTKKTYLMHREVMKATEDEQVDHKDGNGLNNQKINLRICNHNENCWNNSTRRSALGYKGVYTRQNGRYRAYINYYKKRYNLGTYLTPEEAARAYDIAALRYFGEFANTNFPISDYENIDLQLEIDLQERRINTPWNLGKTKDTDESIAQMSKSKEGHTPWNKGMKGMYKVPRVA